MAVDLIGDRSRYGSDAPAGRHCPICVQPVPSTRATFCSPACKQRAWRLRHLSLPNLDELARDLRRRRQLTAASVYECPACQTRRFGERRCPDCNLMCRRVGVGGECPHCGEPVAVQDLLP